MKFLLTVIAAFSLISAMGLFGVANAQTDTISKSPAAVTGHHHDSTMAKSDTTKAHSKTKMRHSEKKLVPQKTCPVMGSPIDTSIFVDYKGKRVYFCCSGCPGTFKKDPEKYLKILAGRGETVEE
jgi:YHS domain-containing protein